MNEIKENAVKLSVTAALSAFCVYFGELVLPLVILCSVMAADYITGLIKGWCTASLSSKAGISGIFKKLGYLALCLCGMICDYLICLILPDSGIKVLFGVLVCIWLIVNECISILENVADCGVPVPAFLIKMFERLKTVITKKGENSNGDK